MFRRSTDLTMLGFSGVCLASWLVMFAAGTDLWHDTGRVDLARVPGVQLADVRALAVAFYGMFLVLLVQFAVSAVGFVRSRFADDQR